MVQMRSAFLALLISISVSGCQTDGGPGPTTTSSAAGGECGGAIATSRTVEGADPALKFPTEPSTFCQPSRSRITLYKPATSTAERLPAVIVLPHCAKMDHYIYQWMNAFTQEGYVVLGLDFYAPRGILNNCHPNVRLSDAGGARDVATAYMHLKSLPFVDPERIAVVGYSFGGTVALNAAADPAPPINGERPNFKAVVAFYPPLSLGRSKATSRLPWKLHAPALVLLGGSDTESPNTPELVKEAAERGSDIELKIYSNAYHSFDDTARHTASRRQAFGFTVIDVYDAGAARQSRVDTLAFLAKHLKQGN
jgi:dienelactone hydrolase